MASTACGVSALARTVQIGWAASMQGAPTGMSLHHAGHANVSATANVSVA
jgi:hypothetical protein